MDVGSSAPVRVYNVYGWTCGRSGQEARGLNAGLFRALVNDIMRFPIDPSIVVGDFNMPPSSDPELAELINTGRFIDVLQHTALAGCLLYTSDAADDM
eukprot:12735890-Alexandrium_andersonii.AAC.1